MIAGCYIPEKTEKKEKAQAAAAQKPKSDIRLPPSELLSVNQFSHLNFHKQAVIDFPLLEGGGPRRFRRRNLQSWVTQVSKRSSQKERPKKP